MSNIYDDRLGQAVSALGGSPDPSPAGNIYVARLDELIAAIQAGGGGGVVPHGNAFPPGPAVNDWYLRDDLGVLCQYDGARWLGATEHVTMMLWAAANPLTSTVYALAYPLVGAIKWLGVQYTLIVNANNDASNYWSIQTLADSASIGTPQTTSAYSVGAANSPYKALNAICTTTNYIRISASKNGSPGPLYIFAVSYIRRVY